MIKMFLLMAQNYTFFSEPPKEIPFIRRSAETEDSNKLNAVRRRHQVKMCPATTKSPPKHLALGGESFLA